MVWECNNCPELDIRQWHQESHSLELCGLQSLDYVMGKSPDGRKFNSLSVNPGVSVIVARANKIRHCRACKAAFTALFDIPALWWTEYCRRANGYFGYEETVDAHAEPDGCRSWARFFVKRLSQTSTSYAWVKLNLFSRWYKNINHTTIILFDPLDSVVEQFCESLVTGIAESELHDPFWIYPRLLGIIVDAQSTSVWTARTQVRNVENERLQSHATRYANLNDIARHVIHISETLTVSANSVEKMEKCHDRFIGAPGEPQEDKSTAISRLASRNIASRLAFYHDLLIANRQRSEANRERVQNEIQLNFNTVSLEIATDTKRDSAAMRTIAFVTMIFLPATFISAVFSTSFFNYSPETGVWAISDKFWVYWAVSAPLTALSFIMWFLWSRLNRFAPVPVVANAEETAATFGKPVT